VALLLHLRTFVMSMNKKQRWLGPLLQISSAVGLSIFRSATGIGRAAKIYERLKVSFLAGIKPCSLGRHCAQGGRVRPAFKQPARFIQLNTEKLPAWNFAQLIPQSKFYSKKQHSAKSEKFRAISVQKRLSLRRLEDVERKMNSSSI